MSAPIHLAVRVPITAAQMKLMNTTSVEIVAGVPGKIINPYNLYLRYFAGVTPFNPVEGDSLLWFIGNTGNALINYPTDSQANAVGFVDQTQDMSQWFDGWMGGGNVSLLSAISGASLWLCQVNTNGFGFPPNGTSDWTEGDGSMLALVEYSLVDA